MKRIVVVDMCAVVRVMTVVDSHNYYVDKDDSGHEFVAIADGVDADASDRVWGSSSGMWRHMTDRLSRARDGNW